MSETSGVDVWFLRLGHSESDAHGGASRTVDCAGRGSSPASRGAAGYRKGTAALHRQDVAVNRKTVAGILSGLGLQSPAAQPAFGRGCGLLGWRIPPTSFCGASGRRRQGRFSSGTSLMCVPAKDGFMSQLSPI
ncbi:IS3 family transposase [Rathayibacter rathayi]|uniref:IS3 family transposase n=1 Tax=Rathayibacter rathayi TaxID=33887 RepID=UPI000F0A9914|nr:IS3 family transposase [Rathayibacter rathayi NCPPB 2980 = VKM Ac-1601]